MPKFNKSKGFQLRSGNKSGMPFKQMGSSPNKQGITDMLGLLGGAKKGGLSGENVGGNTKTFGGSATDLITSKPEENKVMSDFELGQEAANIRGDIKKMDMGPGDKPEPEPQKHKAQIRKQKKLDKITARREGKGKEGLTSKQIRLQKEIDMSAEDFVAHRKEKRAAFGDAMVELGNVIGGKGSFSTRRQKATADRLNKQYADKINNEAIKNYLKGKNEENQLKTTNPTSTTASGHVNFDGGEFKTSVEKEEERQLAEAQKRQQEQYTADNKQKGFSQTDRDMAQWYKDHPNYKGPRNYKFGG